VTSAAVATTQEDRLSIERAMDYIQVEPGGLVLLQVVRHLTTRARRRPALLLHCAKMRETRGARHFLPERRPQTKCRFLSHFQPFTSFASRSL